MARAGEQNTTARRNEKSEAAFRTISEVASELDLPQHVLRFWESKFPNVKPLKRGGGRRYYRPEDVRLLRRIRDLLYNDGYTIRGVQKLLRQNGGKTVTADEVKAPAPAASGRTGFDDDQKAELRAILEELEALRKILKKAQR